MAAEDAVAAHTTRAGGPPSDAVPSMDVEAETPAFVFVERGIFVWKSLALAFATFAIAPVLLWKHALATQVYVATLAVVHLVALGIFVWRLRWGKQVNTSPAGLFWRAVGLVFFAGLLALVRMDPGSVWFWGSVVLVWALHTAALALFHLKGTRTGRFGCPFLS